jgi:hypothetical protein
VSEGSEQIVKAEYPSSIHDSLYLLREAAVGEPESSGHQQAYPDWQGMGADIRN